MTWNEIIWKQFGAAIDMLENAIVACPDDLWQARLYDEQALQPEFGEFWYIASHVLFWLDFYLSESVDGFTPPAPFTLAELNPEGEIPERVYTKDELLTYLEFGRNKCRARLESMFETALTTMLTPWRGMSVAEAMLYNMRHVQEHGSQLNLFLGDKAHLSSKWVSQAKGDALKV